ncbi:MAG: DUF6172 family protein [Gammaproteobacteria bacterium]|nr:DUF6172 family protein [Gammaproteobacteria bacterium]
MKKTFKLTHEKLHPERLIDAIRHEIRKYIKRERKRSLPKGADFWDFDCRFGADEASSDVIHLSEIDTSINRVIAKELDSFYLEILAKPGYRQAKPTGPILPSDKS